MPCLCFKIDSVICSISFDGFIEHDETKTKRGIMYFIRKLLFSILILPISIYSLCPYLQEANDLYVQGNHEAAFEHYSWFLFQFWRHSDALDYYVAFIGRYESAKHLPKDTVYFMENKYIYDLTISELNKEQTEFVKNILQKSVN